MAYVRKNQEKKKKRNRAKQRKKQIEAKIPDEEEMLLFKASRERRECSADSVTDDHEFSSYCNAFGLNQTHLDGSCVPIKQNLHSLSNGLLFLTLVCC
mmetsp:Transcript_39338/g.64362  ORF Transcript_39338/g.64362 Transcript_39338/m.64362 type:complete len:98 (-) Transcript_39338:1214-1507(-)